ncbi:MAG: polyprenyl synthetase family protein [Candidatus Levybacteria bacterium]|nr:polyprenyl synthetase family protein [Candidatus Levybacteria bacterium]
MNDLEVFKQKFDPYLQDYLDKKMKSIINYTKDSSIIDYINYAKKITLSGGKRIRPFIAFLTYQAFGGKETEKVLKLLIALEIFHIFALIHDDIMDKGNMRHGIYASHIYIGEKLKKERGNKNYEHFGNSQAILLGDLFFNWATEIINLNLDFDQSAIQRVRKFFFDMVDGTIVGQMLDIDSQSRQKIIPTLNSKINYLKTARYSFIYPLLIGASLAGELTSHAERFCKELGLGLGIAFQSQDDIFDTNRKHKDLASQKEIVKDNIKSAKIIIANMEMEIKYKKKFLDLVEIIEKRTF